MRRSHLQTFSNTPLTVSPSDTPPHVHSPYLLRNPLMHCMQTGWEVSIVVCHNLKQTFWHTWLLASFNMLPPHHHVQIFPCSLSWCDLFLGWAGCLWPHVCQQSLLYASQAGVSTVEGHNLSLLDNSSDFLSVHRWGTIQRKYWNTYSHRHPALNVSMQWGR